MCRGRHGRHNPGGYGRGSRGIPGAGPGAGSVSACCREARLAQAGAEVCPAYPGTEPLIVAVQRFPAGQRHPAAGLEDPPDLFIGAGGLVGELDGVGAEHRVDAGIGQSRPWSGPTALRSDWEPRSGQRIGTRRGRSRPAFRRAPSGSTAMAASTLWSIRRREALRLRPGVRRRGTQGRVRAAGHHRLARLAEVCAAARRLSDAREILGHDQPQDEPGRGRPGGRDAGFGGRVRRGG